MGGGDVMLWAFWPQSYPVFCFFTRHFNLREGLQVEDVLWSFWLQSCRVAEFCVCFDFHLRDGRKVEEELVISTCEKVCKVEDEISRCSPARGFARWTTSFVCVLVILLLVSKASLAGYESVWSYARSLSKPKFES